MYSFGSLIYFTFLFQELRKAQEFLGVEPTKLESRHVKIHTRPLSDHVNNWSDLSAFLKGTRYESLLNESDYGWEKKALKTHCTYVITLLERYVHLWVGSMICIHTLLGQDALILTYGGKWGGFLCCLSYVIKCEIKRIIVLGMLICLYSQHICGYGRCNVSSAKEKKHIYTRYVLFSSEAQM